MMIGLCKDYAGGQVSLMETPYKRGQLTVTVSTVRKRSIDHKFLGPMTVEQVEACRDMMTAWIELQKKGNADVEGKSVLEVEPA